MSVNKVEVVCSNCHKKYFVNKKVFLNAQRKGYNHFCSVECMGDFNKSGVYVRCDGCGNLFYVIKSKINTTGKNYCSRKCAHECISHSHKHSDETKRKIRNSLLKYNELHRNNTHQEGDGKSNKIEKICPVCKKSFEVFPSKKKRIYCSKNCYLKDSACKFRANGRGGKRQGSGRGEKGWYKGYYCDSSWELAFVIYNLENKIKFERNNQGFEYEYEGEQHKFYPDFIMEDGTYVETKGYLDEKNVAKIKNFPEKITVIGKNEIKEYINYVTDKYGYNFTRLYEDNPHKLKKNKCKICGNPCKNYYCSRKCAGKAANKIKSGVLV